MIRLCGAAVMLALGAPPTHDSTPDRRASVPADPRKAVPTPPSPHRDPRRLRGQESKRRMGQPRSIVRRPRRVTAALADTSPASQSVLYREWTRVAICEEGGWVGWSGPAFPDSLGITAANWWSHGGTDDVSPQAQITVAERIQTWVPDQDGCAPW
jgi:hypothetical protein